MSHPISINVCTLTGIGHLYQIDSGININKFIRHVVCTHPCFSDTNKFNPGNVVLEQTSLIYNGQRLDHNKSFEQYPELQYKSETPFKMHIMTKGGEVEKSQLTHSLTPTLRPLAAAATTRHSSPIQIKPFSLPARAVSERGQSGSYTGSFLESQINRIDREFKARSDSVSEGISLSDLSDKLDRLNSKIDQIYELLSRK